MTVWFASGNIHKKQELADILSGDILSNDILSSDILSSDILSGAVPAAVTPRETGWKLKIPSEAGIAFGPEETGSAFLDNALIKAVELHRLLGEKGVLRPGEAVIADDSGICVDALGGRPGIHSAYYRGRNMPADPRRKPDAAEQNALLLEELGDTPLRTARFVCAMVLYYNPDRFFVAQETLEGELVKNAEAARGKGGFGYDPILYIPALGRTVAELNAEEKNRWSHRGKAGRIISKILLGNILAEECR